MIQVFKSKRISLLTIFAVVITSLSGLAASPASAAPNEGIFSDFTVNGISVTDGSVVEIPASSKSADIFINSPGNCCVILEGFVDGKALTTVETDGGTVDTINETVSDLSFGDHTLYVRGYWPDLGDRNITTVTLRVTPMLSALTVNGNAVADRATVELPANTKSADIVATAVDGNATVVVEGATDLAVGGNEAKITVTDSNNVVGVYTVNLNVAVSENTTATVSVNGEDISSGDNYLVDWGTKEVTIDVQLEDANATYFVTGELGLETGDNTVTVTVTAADGVTTEDYIFNVEVAKNTDTSVNFITINGTPVVDGDEIVVEALTTDVSVAVDTVDSDATVEISGDTDLLVGGNLVNVSVIAADGVTVQEYQFTVNVLVNTDASLLSLTVDGNSVQDADFVVVPAGTTEVEIAVEVNDPEASYEITGGTDLVPGDNELIVLVTAADGETTQQYYVTITVELSTDTSVESITINGEDVDDGSVIEVPAFTEAVDVEVVTAHENSTFIVDGSEGLVVGENTVTVTVTAADELTTQDYLITVIVALNNDASLAVLNVAGNDVADGDSVTVEPLTTEVEVVIETNDPEATYEITGDSELLVGENNLLIVVTAADGETTQEFFITVIVPANTDASLYIFNVAGYDVTDADVVSVSPLTTEVDVVADPNDPEATVEIIGGSELVPGDNDLIVIVTAADGETTQEYFVTITVELNTDTNVESITVNGEAVDDGGSFDVPAFTEAVEVEVVTVDPDATFVIDGNEGLVVGENTVTITVTAADETTTQDYSITVVVAPSNDASVSQISVNWSDLDGPQSATVSDGDTLDLPALTYEVEVVVEPTDPEATYEIEGGTGLVLGENILIITVIAADGVANSTTTVVLNVLPSSDASIAGITVNGQNWTDGARVEVPAGAIDLQVATNSEFATVAVVEATGGVRLTEVDGVITAITASGIGELTVEVTAEDGATVETTTIQIWASSFISVVPNAAGGDGQLRVGTSVKIPRTQFDASAKLTYSWLRDGEEIDGATSAKYLLTVEDYGKDVRPVVVLTKKVGEPVTVLGTPIEVALGLFTKAPVPSIKGKPVVGNTLTAVTRDWIDGTEIAYQWYRDGAAIEGADTDTYELVGYDGETKITVGITGTLEGYESLEKSSKELTVLLGNLKYSEKPAVSGDFVTGGILEVNVGSWQEDAEITIDWIRDGIVFYSGPADDNIYELTLDDYQSKIGMNIKVSAIGYKNLTFTIKPRLIKQATLEEVPTPVVSGDPLVGEVLTVEPGEYPTGAEFTYVWKRNGRIIQGSVDSAYVVNVRDVNTSVTVTVIAKIPGYKTTKITSDGVDITPAQ